MNKKQEILFSSEHVKQLNESSCNKYLWNNYYNMLQNIIKNYYNEFCDSSLFEGIADYITDEDLAEIVKRSASAKTKEDIRNKRQYNRTNLDDGDPNDILTVLWKHPETNQKFRNVMAQLIAHYQRLLHADFTQNGKCSEEKRFHEIKELLSLNDDEFNLFLATAVAYNLIRFRRYSFAKKLTLLAAALNISELRLRQLVHPDGKLRRYDCIDQDIDFNSDFILFLSGADNKPFASCFFSAVKEKPLPWDFYGALSAKHGETLKTLLKSRSGNSGINILLYGEPGTGKTSFANSLAGELGLTLYNLAQKTDNKNDGVSDFSTNFRFAALQVCNNQVNRANSMILIDEADEMLCCQRSGLSPVLFGDAPAGDKGMLNSMLDDIRTPCIWVANIAGEDLDPSSRRRFDYSIKFRKISKMQRENIWDNSIRKHEVKNYLSSELITRLAEKYEVSAGGIDITVSNIAEMVKHGSIDSNQIETWVEKLIVPHCELLGIPPKINTGNINDGYLLDGLNITGRVTPAQIIDAARIFRQEREAYLDISQDAPRMNILLTGAPGTGKTEFVKYLGNSLDCQVMTRMASNFLDMFVGGTEKNIKRAFREAEEENVILFIDEADGMFRARTMSRHSWEITQANELLHAMENFNGILICATNFAQNLDQASIRRFTFKLEFDYLNSVGKELFFEKFFNNLTIPRLSQQDKLRLDAIPDLTPGDFRTVRQSLYYLGEKSVSHEMLLTALEEESHAKRYSGGRKEIGFN